MRRNRLVLFKDTHPEVDVELLELGTVDQETALAEGQIDIGFLHPPLDREEIRTYPLKPSAFFASKRKVGVLDEGPIPWEVLLDERIVFYGRRRAPRLYDAIISSAVENGITLKIVAEAQSFLSAVSAASAGIGTALLPEEFRLRIPHNSAAITIKDCPLLLENAIAHRVSHSNPAAEWFMRYIENRP